MPPVAINFIFLFFTHQRLFLIFFYHTLKCLAVVAGGSGEHGRGGEWGSGWQGGVGSM